MIKLVFCLRRRAGLSRKDFQRYWLETHGPLVRERAKAIGAIRYQQIHTLDDDLNEALRSSRQAPEAYDGVAELWFESREALENALASEEGRRSAAELLEDERRFIDLAHSPLWLADEHSIVG